MTFALQTRFPGELDEALCLIDESNLTRNRLTPRKAAAAFG